MQFGERRKRRYGFIQLLQLMSRRAPHITHGLTYYPPDLADALGTPLAEKKCATEHQVFAVVLRSGTRTRSDREHMLGAGRKVCHSVTNTSSMQHDAVRHETRIDCTPTISRHHLKYLYGRSEPPETKNKTCPAYVLPACNQCNSLATTALAQTPPIRRHKQNNPKTETHHEPEPDRCRLPCP